jgi:endonuclease/exonuclease/phosphatase family metal-dependent hydrolase
MENPSANVDREKAGLNESGAGSTPSNSTQGILDIFAAGFTIVTWNTTALFTQAPRASVSRARMAVIHSLCNQADVVALQETHGSDADVELMQSEFVEYLLFNSPHSNPAAGGVVTMLARRFITLPQAVWHREIDPGRCTATTFFTLGTPVLVINIHMPPHYDAAAKKQLLLKIRNIICPSQAVVFFLGDFNFIASEEHRFDPSTSLHITADHALAFYFDELFPQLCELHQGDYTRKQVRDDRISTLSRLDRIYTNIAAAHLHELRPHTRITQVLTDPRLPSDHVPVLSLLRAPRLSPPRRPRIKPWMARHPAFIDNLVVALRDLGSALEGLADVSTMRDVFAAAVTNFMAGTATADPTTTHEQTHWAIVLLRARQAGDTAACARAMRHYPSLRELPLQDDDTALTTLIADLARKSIAEQLRDISADPLISEMKKVAKKETLRRKAAAWAPLRRTSKTMAIIDIHGAPSTSPSAGVELLKKHWKPTFAGTSIDESPMLFFAPYIQAAPDDIAWEVTYDEFDNLLMAMGDSAPGPDGIPYIALQQAPEDIHRFLYSCYIDVLADNNLPANFNESYMIFLPKGEVDADVFHTARTPDTTRPLNLSNTTAKLVAAALNRSLSKLASRTVIGQQRGFVKGRCMVDNVIEIDDFLVRAARYYHDKHGLILLDIRAAFPSLRQQWIFYVLSRMGIPGNIVEALRKLYDNCVADILFNGEVFDGFAITSGIKQGCPASGSIFALSLDPFIRHLCLQLPPPLNITVAFADDIAIATRTLLTILPKVLRIFNKLAEVAALRLNLKKVKIIPYWEGGKFDTQRYLTDNLPEMMAAEVCSAGTLLGVLLGPEAAQHVMTPAAHKYWHRALEARALATDFKHSLRHYSVFAFPVLSYVIQYAEVPGQILAQEARALQLLTRAPWNAIPAEATQHLKDMHFAYEAPSIARVAQAAAFRAAVKSPAFLKLRDRQEPPDDDLDQLVYPRQPEWTLHSPMSHLIKVFEMVTRMYPDLAPDPIANIQHRLHGLIREKAISPWFPLLRRRLVRFGFELSSDDFAIIVQSFQHQGTEVGDKRRWATLLLCLNALPTAARMQAPMRHCWMCLSPEDDRVEHLVHCPAMALVLARLFPKLTRLMGPVLGIRRTAGALALSSDEARQAFTFNYVITESHRLRRHGSNDELLPIAYAILRAQARRGAGVSAGQ